MGPQLFFFTVMRNPKTFYELIFVVSILSNTLGIKTQSTFPENGVTEPRHGYYAFTKASIVKDASTTLTNATLVIKVGKIIGVGTAIKVPAGAVEVYCKNKFIYPSFIEIYADYGTPVPQRSATVNVFNPAQQLEDDDVDQPYKTAAMLQKAGVLYSISDDDGQTRGRNLAFNAGTAVAYGLTKEEALQAITLNAAKILGVANKTGSIEVGKDANIIISEGDILDMRTSIVSDAFIQGCKIDLNDKHKQLNDQYNQKYNIKKPF